MLPTSQAYEDLMQSNIRPKCVPVITVSRIDEHSILTYLTWESKDITSMTFKRGIDPAGRELPFMELQWTELYKGKFNAQQFPEKYNNVAKYMRVKLEFKQKLGFFNTWKLVKQKTWAQVKESTWKEIKNNVAEETITMPDMFLAARPVVEGNTIKWTARDILSFLDESQTKAFNGDTYTIDFINPICYLLLNTRGGFLKSKEMFESITEIVDDILTNYSGLYGNIGETVVFNEETNSGILHYLNLQNLHFDFSTDKLNIKNAPAYSEPVAVFSKKIIFNYPKITNGTNISTYNFKNYRMKENTSGIYSVLPSVSKHFGELTAYRYDYNGFGRAGSTTVIPSDLTKAWAFAPNNTTPFNVIPLDYVGYDNYINNSSNGEPFNEDNQLNPYEAQDQEAVDRFNFLKSYFNGNNTALEFSSLANPAIETGDIVSVDTNLYDDNVQVRKAGVVVQIEVTFNGTCKEKFIVHELKEVD